MALHEKNDEVYHVPQHIDMTGTFKPKKRFRPTSELQTLGGEDKTGERNDFVLSDFKQVTGIPQRDPLDGESIKIAPPQIVFDLDYNEQNQI